MLLVFVDVLLVFVVVVLVFVVMLLVFVVVVLVFVDVVLEHLLECWFRLPGVVNFFPHTAHPYGLSPVCMRRCLAKLLL